MPRKRKNESIDREERRYGLFVNNNSYDLEMMYGRHYQQQDVNFIITLYRVNIIETKAHKLYGQAKAKNKKYLAPVELNAIVDLDDNNQEYYGAEQGIVREDTAGINIGIYLKELEEKNTEINRGDIIKYNVSGDRDRYFEVDSAQNVSDVSSQSLAGMRAYWKLIRATPVKEDITQFLAGDKIV